MVRKAAFSLVLIMTLVSFSRAFADVNEATMSIDVRPVQAAQDGGDGKIDRDKMRDDLLLQNSLYSPAGAWALSFFIGLFTPFLGAGQYFAKSYATAVPTMLIGFGASACEIVGLVKKDRVLTWTGIGVFGAAWIFDWIYAIVATNKLNDRIREKFKSGQSRAPEIRPLVSCRYLAEGDEHVVNLGLTLRM